MKSGDVKRTLYVCAMPPAAIAGAGVILKNLFDGFPADALGLVVERRQLHLAEATEGPLPWRKFPQRLPRRFTRRGVRIVGNTLRTLRVPFSAVQVAVAARRFRADTIFAVQDGGQLFVAAWLGHLLSRRELFVYAMDDWETAARMHGRLPALIARFSMRRIVRASTRAWAISPLMQAEWQTRFGVKPEILWHSVDLAHYEARAKPRAPGPIRFVCVASIYGVNADAFKRVLDAFRVMRAEGAGAEFVLYTAAPESLPTFDIAAEPGFRIDRVGTDQLPAALAAADVGVLALGYLPEWRRVVEVAVPTKLAEYFAAALPVLVHAPPTATAAQYVRENECGPVVTAPKLDEVVGAMRELATNAEARRSYGANARRVAEQNHSRDHVAGEFRDAFR